jgi:predicted RNA binding protein YcfA (HicA-like mRNA interferase family)
LAGYYADIIRFLKAAGYELLRQGKGDHEIWHHPKTGVIITVDVGVTNRHTANGTLKQAGLPKAF